jgi:hypothetical protein
MSKICTRCGEEKDERAFYKLPSAKSGLNSWCKKCVRFESKKRYTNRINPSRVKKPSVACTIIKKHNEELKDDPERLHSDFLTALVCDPKHRKQYIKKQIEKVKFDPDEKWRNIIGEI